MAAKCQKKAFALYNSKYSGALDNLWAAETTQME